MVDVSRLLALEEEWARRHPAKSAGGQRALGGFHYQFLLTLLLFAEEWSQDQRPVDVRGEALSDILAASAQLDVVTITQVKRTLTGRSLAAALDELWSIEMVARDVAPDLVPQLRYRVACAEQELADVQRATAKWTPAEATQRHEDFLARVSVGAETDVWDRLFAVLVSRFGALEPVEVIERWLGILLSSYSRPDGSRQAAKN
jgi:DNA-binding HxlR family transcriptional regulator